MVYKKYIKKDGKLYGPYIYHSRRVNGKVISEYQGQANKLDYRKFFLLFFGGLFFVILLIFFFNFNGKITGKAIFNSNLQEKNTEKNISIFLKEGELIPASSQIIFETSNQKYSYLLKDLVSEQNKKGDYYIDGKTISGNGEGYGIKGTKLIYPIIHFTLISKKIQSSTLENSTLEEDESNIFQNKTEEENSSEELKQSEEKNITEFEENNSSSPITGGIIFNFLKTISNFFLGITPTGMSISEPILKEIQGEVSVNNPFSYELDDEEEIILLTGSVQTDYRNLSDDILKFTQQNEQLKIETNYSELSEGFGDSYLGDKIFILPLQIPNFNITDNLKAEIVYDNQQIMQLIENAIPPTPTNISINISEVEEIKINSLTEKEREFLIKKFGNLSIQTIKSELFKGRYVLTYKFGAYEITYSYDSLLNEKDLKLQMENDRIKWIKDIINKLSENKSFSQEATQFISDYPL